MLSLSEFASFIWQFRWITYHLLVSNHICQLEVQRAYAAKSINLELRRLIHIYLATKKVPHIMGEPYTVEQVRDVAEYIFRGSDPLTHTLRVLAKYLGCKTLTSQTISATSWTE